MNVMFRTEMHIIKRGEIQEDPRKNEEESLMQFGKFQATNEKLRYSNYVDHNTAFIIQKN